MQFDLTQRDVVASAALSSGSFGMDEEDAAHVFGVLRGTLYSSKERALLREYGANGWDEHVEAGCPEVPIKVVLPTEVEPTLVIRDYGRGLSEANIYGVYARYGKSTKRSNPKAVGFLGIGSKSAFAYTDSFTITSFHGGTKSVYVAVIDESNIGRVDKKFEEPCGDETGIEIRIAVDPADIGSFQQEAAEVFRFFRPQPDINIPLKPPEFDARTNGYVLPTGDDSNVPWTAVVGVVPYRLDLSKMSKDLEAAGLTEVAASMTGGLYFALDEGVSVGAHREEVAYTAGTKKAVIARLRLLFDEIIGELDRVTSDPAATSWAKRRSTLDFQQTTKLNVPAKFKEWAPPRVEMYSWTVRMKDGDGNPLRDADGKYVYDVPRTFRMQGYPYRTSRWGHEVTEHHKRLSEWPVVEVLPTSRILVRDTDKPFRCYHPSVDDHLIVPTDADATVDEVVAELDGWLRKARLDGVPVLRLSELPFDEKAPANPRQTGRGAAVNRKHLERHFVLKDVVGSESPYSRNWDIRDRVPEDGDVFVVISHFRTCHIPNFYRSVVRDRQHVTMLGGTFPTIVGIKTLVKDPVDIAKVKGTPYQDWRKSVLTTLLAGRPDVKDALVDYEWHQLLTCMRHGHVDSTLATLRKAGLPEGHPLVALFARVTTARQTHCARPKDEQVRIRNLHSDLGLVHGTAAASVVAAYERYPLFAPHHHGPDFGVVTTASGQPWLAYVHSVDRENP